jgi:hypothetical protein
MQNKNFEVPYFNGYFPSYDKMSQEQLEFYAVWQQEMQKGNFLEIEGNLGYIFLYLYGIVETDNEHNYNEIIAQLEQIHKAYGEYPKINEYCNFWISDCYIALGQFQEALNYRKASGRDYFDLVKHANDAYTLVEAVQAYCTNLSINLTDFGRKKTNEIKAEIVSMYEEIESGKSINVIEECSDNFPDEIYFLFSGSSAHIGINLTRYQFDADKFISYIPNCYRTAENRLRKKYGFPLIGEGWLTETQLFYEIKKTFSSYKVTQHEKPSFLGRQHLDVYIHDLSIALEYQGEQHGRPIEYFGGEKAYKSTLERDARKKQLCEQNGVTLLYVYPNYSLDDVLVEIKKACSNLGITITTTPITEADRLQIQNEIDKEYVKNKKTISLTTPDSDVEKIDNELESWLKYYSNKGIIYNKKEVLSRENYYIENLVKSELPLDRHHWLQSLTIWYFIHRENPGFIEKCLEQGLKDIELYQDCINQYNEKDFSSLTSELGKWLRDPGYINPKENLDNSFAEVVKKISTVYEKLKKYNEAVEICERAIKLGIKDSTTKGGFERRITLLRKKL